MDKHKGENNIIQTITTSIIFLLFLVIQIVILFLLYKNSNTLYLYIEAIFIFLKIISIIYIIHKPSNPSYKIVWIMLISILPILGILLFIFLGNTNVSRKHKKKVEKSKLETEKYLKYKKEDYMILKEMDIYKYKQACFLTNISDYPVYRCDKVEYLNIGELYFEKLLNDLKKAEKYIFLEYCVISKGSMWDQLFDVLKEKSKKGVKIYILCDQITSNLRLPKEVKEHFNDNIKVKLFNPVFSFISLNNKHRNHRKIVVIDGKIAYTGSINIGDEYINKTKKLGHFKDFGIRITGKAVVNFIVMFLRMWNVSNKDNYLDYKKYIDEEPDYPNDAKGFILPFADGPYNYNNLSENSYINMINSAKKTICITTPYLILDNETLTALTNASLSGIDIQIITSHIPDKRINYAISRAFYDKLLKAGVKIFEYKPGFINGKSCIVDNEVAIIGTNDLDFRKLYLTYECSVWLYNTGTEKKMQDDFLETQENCVQIKAEKWQKRFVLKRIIDTILIAISPLL